MSDSQPLSRQVSSRARGSAVHSAVQDSTPEALIRRLTSSTQPKSLVVSRQVSATQVPFVKTSSTPNAAASASKKRSKDTKRRQKRTAANFGKRRSWKRFVRGVWQATKEFNPDKYGKFRLHRKTYAVMDSYINDIIESLTQEAVNLARREKRKTLMAKDFEAATNLVLPPDLAKYAKSEGRAYLTRLLS